MISMTTVDADDRLTIRPIAREGEQSTLPIGFTINIK